MLPKDLDKIKNTNMIQNQDSLAAALSSFRDLCEDLLSLEGILSATVLRMDGIILYSSHKKHFEPLLSRSDSEAAAFRAAIRMGTRKEYMDRLGGINYAFTSYGRVNQYSIPLDREVKTLLFISELNDGQESDRRTQGVPDARSTIRGIFVVLDKHGIR